MNTKNLRRFLRDLATKGCRVEDGSKSYKVFCPSGQIVVVSRTPSDSARAFRNICADLRRAGVSV